MDHLGAFFCVSLLTIATDPQAHAPPIPHRPSLAYTHTHTFSLPHTLLLFFLLLLHHHHHDLLHYPIFPRLHLAAGCPCRQAQPLCPPLSLSPPKTRQSPLQHQRSTSRYGWTGTQTAQMTLVAIGSAVTKSKEGAKMMTTLQKSSIGMANESAPFRSRKFSFVLLSPIQRGGAQNGRLWAPHIHTSGFPFSSNPWVQTCWTLSPHCSYRLSFRLLSPAFSCLL